MEITGTDSCGNSPKNLFVARFEEHLARRDVAAIAEVLADGCVLEVVGGPEATGREDVAAALVDAVPDGLVAAHVEAAITHGRAASAWGTWTTAGGEVVSWSHVLWFRTLKAEHFAHIRLFRS
ncbi:hypothetical protein BJF85_09700 [Saccharomonospora sp. CUA-673]|uniref:nuclear transport factor 2 family protein n=1 Tax=Saccharomonospora sp. CUA-673 TaxID=1904969 RepID=UPI000964A5D2|nr:nuclear transport factor 2 family protein [Saccharomonospora sp. CUA-673]OLT49153.1 hypothetical protein BJF85_09700 [Saccharomonospora sp. CUA-673]